MHVCVLIFNDREDVNGRAEGELNASPAVNVGLKAELRKLSTECAKGSELEVKFYSTGLPGKLPTNIEELTKEIENFPSTMKEINKGKGIPVQVRILFVSTFDSSYYKRRRLDLNLGWPRTNPASGHSAWEGLAPGIAELRAPRLPRRLLRVTVYYETMEKYFILNK